MISGRREAVRSVVALLGSEGVKAQRLQVSHAFHSPLMEPMLEEFARVAGEVSYRAAHTALVSNVSGRLSESENTRAEYWCRHVREAVRFAEGMQSLHQEGCEIFVEVGTEADVAGHGAVVPGGRRGGVVAELEGGSIGLVSSCSESLGRLYVGGAAVDWEGFDGEYKRRRVSLPTYPFQRRRYWVETSGKAERGSDAGAAEREGGRSEIVELLQQGQAQRLVEALEQAEGFAGGPAALAGGGWCADRAASASGECEGSGRVVLRAAVAGEGARGEGGSGGIAASCAGMVADPGGPWRGGRGDGGAARGARSELRGGLRRLRLWEGVQAGRGELTRSIARISRVCSRRRWREARWD